MRFLPLSLAIAALFFFAPPAIASPAAVLSGDKTAETEAAAIPADELGRGTPRGLVSGFLEAAGKEDFTKAAQYLDLSDLPKARRAGDGENVARKLKTLLDQGGWFFPSAMISNDAEGKKDDESLAPENDIIGSLKSRDETIDILATKTQTPEGTVVWLISSQTLERLEEFSQSAGNYEAVINRILPDTLVDNKVFGAPIGHWLAALALMILSYISCWFIVLSLLGMIKKAREKNIAGTGENILGAVRVPISLYAAVWMFALSSQWAGLSIIVRQQTAQLNVIVAWIAIALLIWRVIDIFAEILQKRLSANGRFFGFSSILFFFRRIVKVIFGIVVAFIVLDNFGVDVTAGLAALGIGGIALALGAQKTLENFIGSLALVIDRPFHIGDFCKIGEVSGTVEDIGMRSTRIRTADKTLITIPNGDLSNQRIENLARRNRFLMKKQFQLRYDTTAEQIRLLQTKIIEILHADKHTTEEAYPVRLIGPVADGWLFEIFCYVEVSDYNENLKVQHDILLQIIDFMQGSRIYCAIPSQTFLPALDQTESRSADQSPPASS